MGVTEQGNPTANFAYDAVGRRIKKTAYIGGENITTYYVTPSFELRERSSDPGNYTATKHVDAQGSGLVASITGPLSGYPLGWKQPFPFLSSLSGSTLYGPTNGTKFYFLNHLGSSSVVTDTGGREQVRYVYQPYGELNRNASFGVDVITHKFTGQEHDAITGLSYYSSRYYDPEMARFLTADTVLPGGKWDPTAFNRYAYARNNPAKYVDPDGHVPIWAVVIAVAMALSWENHENMDPSIVIPGRTGSLIGLARLGDTALGLYRRHQALQVELDELIAQQANVTQSDPSFDQRYYAIQSQIEAVEAEARQLATTEAALQAATYGITKGRARMAKGGAPQYL